MIEVETKVKITNPALVREKLRSIAEFRGFEKKIDDYYTLKKSFKKYPYKSLRIRKKRGIYQVNFKRHLFYKSGIHAKNEIEFEIKDISGFICLLKDFGFRKWLTKEKSTELYNIYNNFNIELNNVKNLGWFLEIEYLSDNKKEKIKHATKEIKRVMNLLGIKKRDIVKEGYTKLLWKKGLISKR